LKKIEEVLLPQKAKSDDIHRNKKNKKL